MKNQKFSKVTVRVDADIWAILEAVNAGRGVAFVVDGRDCVIGVITDGDIRRAITLSKDLSMETLNVGKSNFYWLPDSMPVSSREDKVLTSKYNVVPVLDGDQRLVDVVYRGDILGSKQRPNRVILMAGGLGTRLGDITKDTPKPMVNVGDKPLIEHLIIAIKSFGFHNFTISVNYLKEQIISHFGDGSRWDISIDYIEERQPLGTAGSLSLLENALECPSVVMNGDVLSRINFASLLNFHEENNGLMTLAVTRQEYQIPFGVVGLDGSKVTSVLEKPTHQYFINSGIYVIDPSLISRLEVGVRCDMPEFIQRLISQNEKVLAYPVVEYWKDVGNVESLSEARQDW